MVHGKDTLKPTVSHEIIKHAKKLLPGDSPTHGSDGSESLTLPVPSMQGHTWTTPPGEELIAGQGWHDSGLAVIYSFAGHTVHGCKEWRRQKKVNA